MAKGSTDSRTGSIRRSSLFPGRGSGGAADRAGQCFIRAGRADRAERLADALLARAEDAFDEVLEEASAADLVRPDGALYVYRTEDAAKGIAINLGYARRRGTRVEDLTGDEARAIEPALGASAHHPSVLFACGHGQLGLTLAPVTGRLIAGLAAGRAPMLDLSPYRPDRF